MKTRSAFLSISNRKTERNLMSRHPSTRPPRPQQEALTPPSSARPEKESRKTARAPKPQRALICLAALLAFAVCLAPAQQITNDVTGLTWTTTSSAETPCGYGGGYYYSLITYTFTYDGDSVGGTVKYLNSPSGSDECPPSMWVDPENGSENLPITNDGGAYIVATASGAQLTLTPSAFSIGYIDPKYVVLGVTYAPPGPSSSVTYTNSLSVGTTNSLSNSISSGTSYSVSITYSGGLLGWKGGTTAGETTSSTQTTTDSKSTTINWSIENEIQTSGTPTAVVNDEYTSPVNHDYDIIYIWLNPVVVLSLGQNAVVWNGYGYDANDENGMDIVGIAQGYLNGDFGPIPSQFQTSLERGWASGQTFPPGQSAAINSADIEAIMQSNPFSNSSYGPDEIGPNPPVPNTADGRFTLTACNADNSEPFTQANPSQLTENVTCGFSYSDMTTTAKDYTTSSTTTYSIDKAFQGTGWLSKLALDLNSSSTTTTTTDV
ncbi:MAG: hypothetical protein ABR928_03905, partial [Terracidiphilus sp.]